MSVRESLRVVLVVSVPEVLERVLSHYPRREESGGERLRRYLAEPKSFSCPLQACFSPFFLVGDSLVCTIRMNVTGRYRVGLSMPRLVLIRSAFHNIIHSFWSPFSFPHCLSARAGSPKQFSPPHQSACSALCLCSRVLLAHTHVLFDYHPSHAYQSVYIYRRHHQIAFEF